MSESPPLEESDLPDPLRPNRFWLFCRFLLRPLLGVWLWYRVRGLEKLPARGGALFLINHQSHLDPILVQLGMSRPVCWLARDSLFRVPLLGAILRRVYVLPLNRESAGASSFRRAISYIRHGFILGLFPEGTRTRDGNMGECKPGFAIFLRHGDVPVYPVGVAGAFQAFPRGVWFIRPRRVRVVIGDPFPDEKLKELSRRGREGELVELVRNGIERCASEAEAWRRGE